MGIGVQHNVLEGRTGINCHSIEAITGLETRLENIEVLNTEQQEDIEALQAFSDIDGGAFSDAPGITYEGGTF
jgi:hypothetical protein